MPVSWTREEYDTLRDLARQGLTASQAMKALNQQFGNDRTRNAIIGAAHRLNVKIGKPTPGVLRMVMMRTLRHGKRKTKRKPAPKIVLQSSLVEEEPMPPRIVEPPQGPPWSVSDLTPTTCRWIDGDPRSPRPFACERVRVREKPYCIVHLKKAFGPSFKGRMVAA